MSERFDIPWPFALCLAMYSGLCAGMKSLAFGVGHRAAIRVPASACIACTTNGVPIRRPCFATTRSCLASCVAGVSPLICDDGVGHSAIFTTCARSTCSFRPLWYGVFPLHSSAQAIDLPPFGRVGVGHKP